MRLSRTSMHARAMFLLELERELRAALEREALAVHYQPVVSLASGTIVGFEALARWERSPGVFIPPGDFIGIAEETGLINELGAWGATGGVRPGARVARVPAGGRTAAHGGEPVAAAVRPARPAAADCRDRHHDGGAGRRTAARDHRERAHARTGVRRQLAREPPRSARARLHRRLRHPGTRC